MPEEVLQAGDKAILEREHLDCIFDGLKRLGYAIFGPTLRDGAIVNDRLDSSADLPAGWTDEQGGGVYRIKRRDDAAVFGYAVGPHSWKKHLHPPVQRLWRAELQGKAFTIHPEEPSPVKLAFVGVRACELHAIGIQDRVFLAGKYEDSFYRQRRQNVLIIAAQCAAPGGTCFCASMGTGPAARRGFDLALTEIVDPGRHYFLVEVGSERGAHLLRETPISAAPSEEIARAGQILQQAAAHMGRSLDTAGIKELLYRNYEHPRWEEVSERCLACANCTLVCPTCFCVTVEDFTDLTGEHAERRRKWDSCFTSDFSYIHGGSVHSSGKARYRHWLTHKLASWIDQFGSSGCVGCGRCITWCPVGIDITEEVRAIRGDGSCVISAKEERNGNS